LLQLCGDGALVYYRREMVARFGPTLPHKPELGSAVSHASLCRKLDGKIPFRDH
jgi:hypothetical protein